MAGFDLRERIAALRNDPATASIGIKSLVAKLKPNFGDKVNAKVVKEHIQEIADEKLFIQAASTTLPDSPPDSPPPKVSPAEVSPAKVSPTKEPSPTRPTHLNRDADFENRVIPQAYKEYTVAERRFMVDLSIADRVDMSPRARNSPYYSALHQRAHIEILLTLYGVKPCTLYAHGLPEGLAIFDRLVQTCLMPVMEKFKLDQYGFALQKIHHPVPTEHHHGYQGSWIFFDTRSPDLQSVQDVFLTPHRGVKLRKEVDVANALGFLAWEGTDFQAISYRDVTEQHAVEMAVGAELGAVNAMVLVIPKGTDDQYQMVKDHMDDCQERAERVGTEIIFDFSGHEDFATYYSEHALDN